ncbi:hypothetical protein [Mycoplasmoides fastidiosum]|uniref:hypothetical protein n=1 Tax=Mycoplasmoides fastidiosum TaxID=92758 RepID=UPI00211507BE|nr:hypothetical protein [Mycoplasmoides fastidiosum]UUD37431.1 hypothetical protein NPA10_02530 [Mycoplasmoides fastidiosum]
MKIAWKYIKKEIILLFLSTFFMVFFEAGIIFLSAKMTQSIFDAIQIELEKYYLFFLYYLLGIVGFLILDFISVWFYYLSFNKIHFMILNGVSSIIFDQYRRTTNKTFCNMIQLIFILC